MNPSTLQARVLVDEFLRGGVREAVLCPGSRNAPLSFALHAAERAGRVRLHVRIDERSAGFLAVGLAAASGAPVIVVMTSGTAVANLGPAVCEANYARVPLIVLSANRPYEVLGSGVNQVIEQLGLFGSQVREAVSAGLAEQAATSGSQWRARVVRALSAATGTRTGNAGPVQFDVPFREPLVPQAPEDDLESHCGGAFAGRPGGGPWTQIPQGGFEIPTPIDLSVPTVVVSGHGAGSHPELAALPTVAEPTAPVPANPLHPFAVPHVGAEQAVICGRPTLHRQVASLLADPAVRVYALTTGPRWPDVAGNVAGTGTRAVPVGSPDPAWLQRCARAHAAALGSVGRGLDAEAATTGLHVARAVLAALRPGDQLVLGASNPVRDVALAGGVPAGVAVRSNRGVSGIDGVLSSAVGSALAHEGRTIALLGDLTFLHDVSGLVIGPHEPKPRSLAIVVANDDGGGIFELLEQGGPEYRAEAYGDAYERLFGTPHGKDFSALCAGLGVAHVRAALDELPAALGAEAEGLRVVEVRTDRGALRDLHRAMREFDLGEAR
ncbi:2-succinyl-5-enolpyruvyl-6-hydroxy-3-cyclohexene-1-carboxylic-acid synthase [Segniliparus rotundus DSM 44985]|uniref:2-succinyl-5-enolpyruvyl-6-hydroxy-3-cyclohexene-1-carboxylate synthase n=1 Tax=Segniliparus rotundus (strain ATCC BAA-972 / CDC 1076 / CIP 108378 / DSM 44985 / JCM 13578) TaxID=640132 RepID=D6ZCP6_SEGRD|nr:2-succinyl-5-enolpyruvyl-6-hydroxy-3-cyclohexene-1-carboxylic-acid synthase [Segniliparus rotundus]ADG97088.1 2-succinyl-5-enolpyruvyl-6-hydroxy-3-cyclohexene-1-carboxylic-acid synthase [Segniliparus rotundus DSM 44985]